MYFFESLGAFCFGAFFEHISCVKKFRGSHKFEKKSTGFFLNCLDVEIYLNLSTYKT